MRLLLDATSTHARPPLAYGHQHTTVAYATSLTLGLGHRQRGRDGCPLLLLGVATAAGKPTDRTSHEGHPTSTTFPLSPTEVEQPIRSIAENVLVREKMRWKKECE
ncbi:hypothetical protein GW17_00056193 [Ensete ventricosum]|nr:hypothetical protein GW17_00056193 [Ensete ventricosum]